MLFDIPLESIDERHLQGLINTVPEGRQIEYKQQLPGNAYDDIVEFLKDISSMSNTLGGDVLYGVREGRDTSGNTLAVAIDGVTGVDADREKLRLEHMLLNNIRPRIIGIRIETINLENGNAVFIIRVPRSWNAPHVVEYQRHWRFYFRNSAGNHPMDVTELRHAITFQDTLKQRLEEFRVQRLALISVNEGLNPRGKVVLHFQPFESLNTDYEVDLRVALAEGEDMFLLHYDNQADKRLNFDGVFTNLQRNPQGGYLQVFRNGSIEDVDARLLNRQGEEEYLIDARQLERKIVLATARRLRLLKTLNVPSPAMLHLSLLSVRGYRIHFESEYNRDLSFLNEHAALHPIDRSDLLLRGILIESLPAKDDAVEFAGRILRPLFDAIWNAGGFQHSMYYEGDKWTGILKIS